jgi:epidermal growth factor receptor substrate 15
VSVIKNSVIIFLCLVFAGFQAFAQTNEERRERADKLFEKEQYVEATKDYLHLLSLEPRSADLNFRYGACLLFNSNKKNESIRYLSFAVTEPNIDSRAFYFHGLALHLNYQFAEAQRSYGTYVNLNIGKTDKRYPADRQIEMCNNGKRLLTTFTDIIVAEKQEIDSDKFFRIYTDANTIGGDILVTAKFQSKMDLKMGHVPIVHFPPNANAIYYSSYGESLANGKDIYVRRRLPSGDWGEPQILPGMVNSRFDEDFPYMHPSGNYLYFSSTGHNSMGGYDVYMSRFDPNTNSFREPENVDFAISSPDDDYFYVVDSLFQNAYFASARQSQDGMLHVYKVKVARVPLKEVIIMGEFISEVDPEMKGLEINLTYHSNSKDVGLVKSNKVGKYSYVFPQGGKYNYTVSVAGLNEDFQFVVDLPFLDELRPLKQKIIHTKEDGKDVLKILNLFDEDVEGAEAIIADVIRKKAELNVNIDQFDVDEVEAEIRKKEVLAELGFNYMRPEEIAQKLEELSTINSDKSKVIDQMENNLAAEIVAKSERIQTLEVVQNELTEQAMKTSDPLAKHNLLSEAQRKEAEKQTLIASVQGLVQLKEEALSVLKSNDNVSSGKQLAELKKSYEGLIRNEEDAAAIELLSDNKTLILSASKGTPEDLLGIYVDKATDLRERIKAEGKKEQEINKTIDAANQELNKLQGSLELAKNKDRPTIERQIADKQDEIKMAGSDLLRAGEKKREMAKELAIVEEQIASLQSAMNADEIVAVKNDDVERSVKAVEAISEIPSKIDYENELAKIEEESPALFNKGDLTVYDEIRTELNKDKAAVSKDSKLSNAERTAKELALVEEAIEKLEVRTTDIGEELKSNPSDAQLLAEQQKTLAYVKQLKVEEKQLNQELLAIRTENPDLAYSKVDVLREIDPSFESEIATIRNSSDDELLTVTKELERTTELIEKLKVDLGETKKAFEANPGDPELEAKFALVDELLTDYQKTTKALSSQKEQLEAERALKPLDPDVLYAGFNEQLTSITAAQLSRKIVLRKKKHFRLHSWSAFRRKRRSYRRNFAKIRRMKR